MPAEDGTDDVLDGEEYPDGKLELFPQFDSHREKTFYSIGEEAPEDVLCPELSMEELKAAFRYFWVYLSL